jgi:hypothetical protein
MAVFTRNVLESIYFQEATKKNLHTASVVEVLQVSISLGSNFKGVSASDRLLMRETLVRSGGIINKSISETLDISETNKQKHVSPYVNETLVLDEGVTGYVIPQGLFWAGDLSPPYQTSPDAITKEIPVGAIDGVNADFVLAAPLVNSEMLIVYVNEVLQILGTHYTFSVDTITFNGGYIPAVNSDLLTYHRT